jgi:hypothetical protein
MEKRAEQMLIDLDKIEDVSKLDEKKQGWIEATKKLQEYLKNPKMLPVQVVNGCIVVPNLYIGGYFQQDNGTILEVMGKNNTIMQAKLMNSMLQPRCIVGYDKNLKNHAPIEDLSYVLLSRHAEPEGEFYYDGLGFMIFAWHNVQMVINDIEDFNTKYKMEVAVK